MSAKWPTSVAADADLGIAVNNLSTTLNGAINNSTTTVVLTSATGFPTAGYVTIDTEAIQYTGISTNTLTGVTRGADGTTAASHSNLAAVNQFIVAAHHNDLKNEIEAIETYLSGNLGTTSLPLTASRALATNSSQKIVAATTTDTELGYVNGVTSAIQTQINTKSLVFLGSVSASSQATVDFTSLAGSSYSEYVLYAEAVIPATNSTSLLVQISTGSGFITSGYVHSTFRWTPSANGQGGSASDSAYNVSGNSETVGNGAGNNAGFQVGIHGVDQTTGIIRASWTAQGQWASNTYVMQTGGGAVGNGGAAVDGVRCKMSSGNITSGKFRLYGVRNA